jgi:hypothetical protein
MSIEADDLPQRSQAPLELPANLALLAQQHQPHEDTP